MHPAPHSGDTAREGAGTAGADVAAIPWLTALTPRAAGARLTAASSGLRVARAADAVGAEAVQWAIEVGFDVAERVAAEIPGHVGDGGLDLLRMGTESTTIQLLMVLAGYEGDDAVTAESLDGVPDFVHRQVSLEEMLRGIALGHSVIAAAFLTECSRLGDPANRHEQMRALSESMFVYFDSFSTQMAAAYREEEAHWMQSEAASKLALVEDLLSGHELAPEQITRRLRYDVERTHVALMVWSTARTIDVEKGALYDATATLLREIGCEQKLIILGSRGIMWAWLTPWGDPTALIERLAAVTLPAHTYVSVGSVATGMAGFRSSHDDAAAAFALIAAKPAPEQVTKYRDVDLLTLLMADRERARRFAWTELGALAAPGTITDELRRTLSAFLDEGGSAQATAQRLQVARNTVTNRIRRIEETLGRSLAHRRQQLQAALVIFAEHTHD